MAIDYQQLIRELESELESDTAFQSEFEEEVSSAGSSPAITGSLQSLRFKHDADLQATAQGRLRLGRPHDSPYPAPIRSSGSGVRKVQQALIDLGFPLPRFGDDAIYGQETYQAVLAYKRKHNILTPNGYLDGIVGTKTIAHLDSNFHPGPLPACQLPGAPVLAEGEFENTASGFGIPWVTCDPLLEPTPGGLCDKMLPDSGKLATEGGSPVKAPSLSGFYCINKPHIHLEFTASWEEMLPPDQRPPDQRNRALTAPHYDISFRGYKEEHFIPGKKYVRDITVTSPGIGGVTFLTSLQKNRIFSVEYKISESN